MKTVNTKLIIPDKYVKDFASGAIDISKAVLRNTKNGKIVKHADLIVDNRDTAKDVVENVGVKNLGIAGLVVGGVALLGFGIYKVADTINKSKKNKISKSITEFHKKLNKYLEDTKEGKLDVKTIDELLNSIDEIEKIDDKNIKIDFSTKEVKELLKAIYKFTIQINKENENSKIRFKAPSRNSHNNITYLKEYLKYQRQIAAA